jgi:hypothetical protein
VAAEGHDDEPDFSEVEGLLQEARSLIAQYSAARVENDELHQDPEDAQARNARPGSESGDSEMAAEHIQQALDEAKVTGLEEDHAEQGGDAKEGDEAVDDADEHDTDKKSAEADSSLLDLPSVPSGPSKQATPKKDTDDELLARLEALKVGGPRATGPRTGTPAEEEGKDEDVETWCAICCDNATVKCLGCDGELYCGGCWAEGHRGPDAGREFRGHQAVLYQKPRKKKRMVAA